MGITMRQHCDMLAGAYESQERQIKALQQVILRLVKDENGCTRNECEAYKNIGQPWHAERCGCASEARGLYVDFMRVLEAEAFK